MQRPSFYLTDVFTDRKFGGNQLATFVDCDALTDQEMQSIAKEINFSETTFITSRLETRGGFDVRIFTPNAEVDFAGHPTLGTAYVIRELLRLTTAETIKLNLRIGQIPVAFTRIAGGKVKLQMQQVPPTFAKHVGRDLAAKMLGLPENEINTGSPIQEVSTGFPTLIVPVARLATLKSIKIEKDIYTLFAKDAWAKIVLAYTNEGYESGQDLAVRVFADYYGVAEDAATGSSNGALAAYLSQYRCFGSTSFECTIGQGYEIGRPSNISIKAVQSGSEIEVFVGGMVVEVGRGEWA